MMKVSCFFLLVCGLGVVLPSSDGMKLYKKMDGENKYRQVLVAVSSTVIPLDDLPTFTVSSRIGGVTELPPPGVSKPDKPPRLITASKKKPSGPLKKATVHNLTKEKSKKN